MIRGKVVEITTNGADAPIDTLSKRYLGIDKYPNRQVADEVRVLYRIEPTRVSTLG